MKTKSRGYIPASRRVIHVPRGANICPCTGKTMFATAELAAAELTKVQELRRQQGQRNNVETRHYLCASCMGHHLTAEERHKK